MRAEVFHEITKPVQFRVKISSWFYTVFEFIVSGEIQAANENKIHHGLKKEEIHEITENRSKFILKVPN